LLNDTVCTRKTIETVEKVRKEMVNWALIVAVAAGTLEGLLLARFVARLLAARPDNPAVALLYGLTGPLVAPLAALDYDQPPFGAALEFSTLLMATLVPIAAYLAWVLLHRATIAPRRPS
jgi:hypothetical protein